MFFKKNSNNKSVDARKRIEKMTAEISGIWTSQENAKQVKIGKI